MGVSAAALACMLPACAPRETVFTVAADGSGQFRSVQAAVDAVPAGNARRVVIRIEPGRYEGHVVVPADKPFITFQGDDPATTVLTDDKNVDSTGAGGVPLLKPETSTVYVLGDDFSAENVSFENTAGNHGQAMALTFDADRGTFRSCRFLGWQDTLRINRGRSYFVGTTVAGSVDFIYGKGIAVFERCQLHSRANGYITAAATPQEAPSGFVFLDCKVTAEPSVTQVFLGRPWRPFAAVAFLRTDLCRQVAPTGWDDWGKAENRKTARFAERRSTGPGAGRSRRAAWAKELSDAEAAAYTAKKLLAGKDGWDPTAR